MPHSKPFIDTVIKGAGGLISLSLILMLALAVGTVCKLLGTGVYLASAAKLGFGREFIPAALFVITSLMAFATGTSWGTWGIMFPIAIPIAQTLDMSLPPVIGALLSGGVFGDHCSPISDTTIISSMASASDHIDHVRTQLPYALLAGTVSTGLFLITGLILY